MSLVLLLASWCWSQSTPSTATTRPAAAGAAVVNPSRQDSQPADPARPVTIERVAGENDATPIRRRSDNAAQNSAASSSSSNPSQRSGSIGSGVSVTRVSVALGIVLLLIFGLRWAARGMFPGAGIARSNRAVQVLSRTVISPKQQLLLVQVGRRVIVVADSGTQMNPLCEITDADEIASLLGQVHAAEKSEPISRSFRSLFHRAEQTFGPGADGSSDREMENSVATRRGDVHDGALEGNGSAAALGTTQEELSGLMEKVRLLSKQFRRT